MGDKDKEYIPDPQIYVESLRAKIGHSSIETMISKPLVDSMTALIWDMKYINMEPTFCQRLLDDLNISLMNGVVEGEDKIKSMNGNRENEGDNRSTDTTGSSTPSPSDIKDLLEYKPTEIISDKATQILMLLCLGQISSCFEEMKSLKVMLDQQCIKLHNDNYVGFWFTARTLECFANFITGQVDQFLFNNFHFQGQDVPSSDEIPSKSQLVVIAMKCSIGRHFRYNINERLHAFEKITMEDPTNFEWFITMAEATRKKRRESSTARVGAKMAIPKQIEEEYNAVAEGLLLAPQNPFVQMSVMDCIIDCLRDTKGQFKCGNLTFESSDEAIEYMRATSMKLLEDFPNSVKFHSLISDYFCRLVPLRYFDVPFAEDTLQRAYELNPLNPKTTHRLGIFIRASKGDLETSYSWFQKTVELNPIHFNATMECIKNKLTRPTQEKVVEYMDKLMTSSAARCWSEHEILELLFHKGLAHFALNEKEKALEIWNLVVKKNDYFFRLIELDRTCGFYNWNDKQISSDQLRIWIFEEKKLVDEIGMKKKVNNPGDGIDSDMTENSSIQGKERQKLVELLFSLMIGGGYPSRPCPNSGPFQASKTYQLFREKLVIL